MQHKWLKSLANFNMLQAQAEDSWGKPFWEYFIEPQLENAQGKYISVQDVIQNTSRVIILGGAGSGKTTLLRFLAIQLSKSFLHNRKSNPCPIFIRGRNLGATNDDYSFGNSILNTIIDETGLKVRETEITKAFNEGQVQLLIDGLDEIPEVYQAQVLKSLIEWAQANPQISIIVSSRPSALTFTFSQFSIFNLSAFNEFQIEQLIVKLAQSSPEMIQQFKTAIFDHRFLADLAINPLLLRLLWNVFEYRGLIATNPTFLYSDFTDYLLSTWDKAKGIGQRSSLTLSDRHYILERLAVHLYEKNQIFFEVADIRNALSDISLSSIIQDDFFHMLDEIMASGLITQDSKDKFFFAHKSFLEYYMARAISRNPSQVIRFLDRRDGHDIIVFSCGLLEDIAPLIEAAIDRRYVLLAAKCLSNGRTHNRNLTRYVVREFTREVGQQFVDILVELNPPEKTKLTGSQEITDVLDLWEKALAPNQPSQEKGYRFEEFAQAFFGKMFKIVSRDLNTENGELDLIIEIGKLEPFWIEFGGDALVECKNWGSNVPLKEVGAFIAKVWQARVKLAFFVSVSGFTEDAIRTLKNNASNVNAPLIVPISGDEIKTVLLRGEVLEEFFKDSIRSVKYLRKY